MAATTTDKTGAGTEEKTGAAFDPAAFETKITTAINNGINGLAKELKGLAKILKEAKAAESAGDGTGDGTGTGESTGTGEGTGTGASAATGDGSTKTGDGKGSGDAAQNTELRAYRKQQETDRRRIQQLEQKAKDDEAKLREKDRVAAINEAMADIQFRDDAARKLFFRGISPDIVYNDDGELVANTPEGPISVAAYIKDAANTVEGLLKPNGAGGAGARTGKAGTGTGTGEIDMNDLTPEKYAKLKPEEKAAIFTAVANAHRDAIAGKP